MKYKYIYNGNNILDKFTIDKLLLIIRDRREVF